MRVLSSEKMSQSFIQEWNEAAEQLRNLTLRTARGYGCSPNFEAYLESSGGFWKFIYPLAGWIEDRNVRQKVGVAFALHCYGIKILDDIIDQDRCFTDAELLVGHQFCDHAMTELASLRLCDTFFEQYANFWPFIWAHLRKEPSTRLENLRAWKESAFVKCGMILKFYASVGVIISGKKFMLEPVGKAMLAMGVIYTLLDDIRDASSSSEAHSNVWALFNRAGCTIDDLEELLSEQSAVFESNMHSAPSVFPSHLPCQDAISYCQEFLRRARKQAKMLS